MTSSIKLLVLAALSGAGAVLLNYVAIVRSTPSEFSLRAMEPVLDLGHIKRGSTDAEFRLVNNARVPVRIIGIVKTCRCAVVAASTDQIEPSQAALVRCRWNTSGLRGQSKTGFLVLYRTADQPTTRTLPLQILGTVLPEFEYVPAQIEFPHGEPGPREVRLVPKSLDSDLIVRRAYCTHQAFRVERVGAHTLSVEFVPRSWSDNVHLKPELVIETNCSTEGTVRIPLLVGKSSA